jgi:hypothetical protein
MLVQRAVMLGGAAYHFFKRQTLGFGHEEPDEGSAHESQDAKD